MTPGEPIEIRRVSNGFIARPIAVPGHPDHLEAYAVFNSIADLSEWLFIHFAK